MPIFDLRRLRDKRAVAAGGSRGAAAPAPFGEAPLKSDRNGILCEEAEAASRRFFIVHHRKELAVRKPIYQLNFERLEKLMGQKLFELQAHKSYRLRSGGYMDLVVERLTPCEETGPMELSMTHYYEQNGDLCPDPDMTLKVYRHGMLEALSFQQTSPSVYQVVYPEPGKFYPRLKPSLNNFLGTWLRNLEAQGHRLITEENEAKGAGD